MKATALSTFLATAILGVSALTTLSAHAQCSSNSVHAGDKYDFAYRTGKFDTYTEGANLDRRDPFADDAHGIRIRDPFTDGARNDAAIRIAGMDRTGVSAPPAHSNGADSSFAS